MKQSNSKASDSQPKFGDLPKSLEVLTIAEAVLCCNISDDTLRRRLAEGAFKGAFQDPTRRNSWFIPLDDLRRAGFTVRDIGSTRKAALEDEVSQRDALLAEAALALQLSEMKLGAEMQRADQATEEVQHLRRWLDQMLSERQLMTRSV